MKQFKDIAYIYYLSDNVTLDKHKSGKWMYFFDIKNGIDFADKVCRDAVEKGIVQEAKYTNPLTIEFNPFAKNKDTGLVCFYLEIDDMEAHKRVINYFIENNMIKKTKLGRYYNNSFKLDDQTRAGDYGDDFVSELKLEQLIDLTTGEWIAD